MKNLYLYMCILLYGYTTIAQTPRPIRCGTEEESTASISLSTLSIPAYTGSTDLEYLNSFAPISFNIHFWIITNGTNEYNVTAQDIQLNLNRVNELFKPMGICFVLHGSGTINNPNIYANASLGEIVSYANEQGYVVPNCFNIYLPKSLSGSANGVTNYGEDKLAVIQENILGLWEFVRGNVLAHELAHTFGLRHPWGTSGGSITTDEHVTRDTTSIYYNADEKGDFVRDTPAMASFWREASHDGVSIYEIIDVDNCEYTGDLTDDLGVPFDLTPADVGNPMAYTWDPCVTGFTVGQGIRIREYIEGSPTAASVLAMTSTECETCSENLTITLPVVASQKFNVENVITGSSKINNDIQVIYAGEEINLLSGFETSQETTLFVAEVSPCGSVGSRLSNPDMKLSADNKIVSINIAIFSVSPNPANSVATVVSTEEIVSIIITSMDGKVLYHNIPSTRIKSLDVVIDDYMGGIYNMTITTINGRSQTQKLVKN